MVSIDVSRVCQINELKVVNACSCICIVSIISLRRSHRFLRVFFSPVSDLKAAVFRYDGIRFAAEALKLKNQVGAASVSRDFWRFQVSSEALNISSGLECIGAA